MSIFDEMKNKAGSGAANPANAAGKSERFVFTALPANVQELMSLPEASLDTPYKTTALTLLALLQFEHSPDNCYAMLDALRGPDPMSAYAKSFIKDRLAGKEYIVKSFFAGAAPANNYTPSVPYTITVSSNPYSFPEENWAAMFVQSSGADGARQVKLRRKPSTNQWFLNDILCLRNIRTPAANDPWA